MNHYGQPDVVGRLKKLFGDRYGAEAEKVLEGKEDIELMGAELGLSPRDLLYIFFDVEKEFSITVPEEDIAEGRFKTLNGIAAVVYKQLEKMYENPA